ncbi:MAG: ammonium transporter [Hyphomicrobium sp.]
MTFGTLARTLGVVGALGAFALAVDPALAQEAAAAAPEAAAAAPAVPAISKADTAFMYTATVLVILMTIPGLALFYGGLVRTKNMLSVLMQVFAIFCVVSIIFVAYGYSLAFTNGGELNDYVGGLSKAFLSGVNSGSVAATFSNGVYIPEYTFIAFQMTFACITPALIVGAFAERVKFSALLLFSILWVTLIYFPMAHMVWYWGGPDYIADAAKAGADQLAAASADAGLLFKWGAVDFAGGTVVHINAGIAGLVCALIVGKRVGYGKEAMPPHSLVMTMIGASLLWVGWFGFNVGSNLEANGTAATAFLNTFVATSAAALAWMLWEWMVKGHPSLLGIVTGAVAGLVAITPACGFAGPMGSIILGLIAGVVCYIFSTGIKNALGYDDSLDVFGVHCIGGIIGAIGTGILINPDFGGSGVADYASKPGELVVAAYDMVAQVTAQAKAVGLTLLWSGIGTAVLFKLVDIIVGLRPTEDKEREGLDITEHGERAYNY